MFFVAEFGVREPVCGEFAAAIGHVFPSENTESKHLFRREIRGKAGIKVLAFGFGKNVCVVLLHAVRHVDCLLLRHGVFSFNCRKTVRTRTWSQGRSPVRRPVCRQVHL